MDCDLWQKYESHHEVLECEMAEWKKPIVGGNKFAMF